MAAIDPYTGVLGLRLAKHLLRRTTFNFSKDTIEEFALLNADVAVNRLMDFSGYAYPQGPCDASGTPWLTASPSSYSNHSGFDANLARLVAKGWINYELYQNPTAEAKMAVWLHTCFITANDGIWEFFEHWRLIFWGIRSNLKLFSEKVTLDRQMLLYLNNNQNTKTAPNENYAREFLELFTIRRGQQIGTGNYTNYTESDIQQAAKVLTGFDCARSEFSNKDAVTGLATGSADYSRHDTTNKTFSSAFGGRTIVGATSRNDMYRELRDFIDMVFNQVETARSFVRRAYRFYVSDNLDQAAETQIIEPLAQQLYASGYQVKPMITALLKSRWFYDQDDNNPNDEVIGGKLKSDIDLRYQTLSFFRIPEQTPINPINDPEEFYRRLWMGIGSEGIQYPASVEGYPGFYKGPSYSRFWFASSSIVRRYSQVKNFLDGRIGVNAEQYGATIDIVDFVRNNFVDQENAQSLVTQAIDYFLPDSVPQNRFNYFYESFLGSLSPINWMFEWQGVMGGGDSASVRNSLRRLFNELGSSPEFQVL
jgi:hypothetical protein